MSTGIVSSLDAGRVKVLVHSLSDSPNDNSIEVFRTKLKNFHSGIDLNVVSSEMDNSDDLILNKLGGSGRLNFDFINSLDSGLKDFIDFQLHQRVYALILVSRDKEVSSISVDSFQEKFPYKIAIKTLSLDSSEDVLLDELKNLSKSIVKNMSELYKEVSVRPALPSPCGLEDYSGTASVAHKVKMRLSGRVQKLLADLHLLTGCYSDSVACYVSANEDAKAVGDTIWSAAAQEGFHTALCLQNEQLLSKQVTGDIYKTLIDKLHPLAIIYERTGVPILSICLQITCSRIYRFVNQNSQGISVLGEAWKSCNLLAFEEKIMGYNKVLKELAITGSRRKWGLYMLQLAQTLKLAQKPEAALVAISKTLSVYNLKQSQEYKQSVGWPALHASILKDLVKLSETHSNRLLYFLYGWMYLAYSNKWHDTSDQVQIMESLKKKSIRDMFSLNSSSGNSSFVCGLPIFVKLSLDKGNSGLFVSERSLEDVSGPFIYTPESMIGQVSKANFKEDTRCLIVGEWATFKLCLSNPFVFPIVLKNVYLLTNDRESPRLSEQISLTLPPITKNRNVPIGLIPKNPGKLKVLGFCATFMNVEIQFLIDSSGKIMDSSSSSGIKCEVIPPQPNLKCLTVLSEEACLRVYQGETLELPITIENFGAAPVSSLNFRCEDLKSSVNNNLKADFLINEIIFGASTQAFEINFTQVQESLPMNENAKFNFNLRVNGTFLGSSEESFKRSTLEIYYSTDSPYWRKLSIPVCVNICPIMKLEDFSFFPYLSGSSASKIDFTDKIPTEEEADDFCVASFVISNLESFPLRACLKVKPLDSEISLQIPSKTSNRVLFVIPRTGFRANCPIQVDDKKIAAIRKLKRSDHTDFVDETFEDLLYDKSLFWIKKYVIESLTLEWSIFDQNSRNGSFSFSQTDIEAIYHLNLFKEPGIIKVNRSEFNNIILGHEIAVTFTISPPEKDLKKNFYLKLFPVVPLSDSVVGLNIEKFLFYTGCLDSIVRFDENSVEIRKFFFYPISLATIKIIYQLIDVEAGTVHWCHKPISITTVIE